MFHHFNLTMATSGGVLVELSICTQSHPRSFVFPIQVAIVTWAKEEDTPNVPVQG